MKDKKEKIIAILGPTATGKTALGIKIARRYNGELISVDSRQVYRGLDLGTGKDLEEYGEGEGAVPYHLIDIVSPKEGYNLSRFKDDAQSAIDGIIARNRLPLLVGGSALYLDSLFSNYSMDGVEPDYSFRESLESKTAVELGALLKEKFPKVYEELSNKGSRPFLIRALENASNSKKITNTKESNFNWLILGVYFTRAVVHERIEKRLDARLHAGMIDEVKKLHYIDGVSWKRLDAFGLEYRYISFFLRGEMSFDEMRDKLFIKIRRLARSQDIWYRKMERKGHRIHWIEEGDFNRASELIEMFFSGHQLPEPKLKLMDIYYGPKS